MFITKFIFIFFLILMGLPAPALAQPTTVGEEITSISIGPHLDLFVSQFRSAKKAEELPDLFLKRRSPKELAALKSELPKLRVLPEVHREKNVLVFTYQGQKVSLEFIDREERRVKINGKPYVFDPSFPIVDQIEVLQSRFFAPKAAGLQSFILPEAHAFAWALPAAWGPLMIGIGMSGVFADYLLRPAVNEAHLALCAQMAGPGMVGRLKRAGRDLRRDGICKAYFDKEHQNTCVSADKTKLQYEMVNSDGTVTSWAGLVNASGQIFALQEFKIDKQKKPVSFPVEYRFDTESGELTQVKTSPTTSLKRPEIIDEKWTGYAQVAALMRAAVALCQPGMYDQLLGQARQRIENQPSSPPTAR